MSALDADELASRVHAINERSMVVLNAARCEEKAREDQTVGLGMFTGVTLAALRSDRYLLPDAPGQQAQLHRHGRFYCERAASGATVHCARRGTAQSDASPCDVLLLRRTWLGKLHPLTRKE